MLLLDLTTLARNWTDSSCAFVFYATSSRGLSDGIPKTTTQLKETWLREFLTGDEAHDSLLTTVDLRRIRRTHLERHRRPVAHTRATLSRYLRGMQTVKEEGFQIVREALDAEVNSALARRQMHVEVASHDSDDPDPAKQDTVLGECTDYEHSPFDGGHICRQTFLTCLDCTNARAFPRHLPFQLAAIDAIRELRTQIPLPQWTFEFSGRLAQLEQITSEFAVHQRDAARKQINDDHRQLASRLIAGELNPS